MVVLSWLKANATLSAWGLKRWDGTKYTMKSKPKKCPHFSLGLWLIKELICLKKVSFYLNLNKTSGVLRLMPGEMLRIVDMTLLSAGPKSPVSMYIKVPALPSHNPSSTQRELDHNGLKQTEAELNRIQFSVCYSGWLLSMFCAKENLKHRRKARGDQIGTTRQKFTMLASSGMSPPFWRVSPLSSVWTFLFHCISMP